MTLEGVYGLLFWSFGVYAAVSDFRRRRIDNRLIVIGLGAALLGYAYLACNTLLGSHRLSFAGLGLWYLPASFYPQVALHAGLCVVAAITLWYLRVWPAGDAKLFILLSSLLPLAARNLPGFPSILAVILLINIFVLAGIFVAAVVAKECLAVLPQLLRRNLWEDVKAFVDTMNKRIQDEWPRRHKILMLVWNTFALFLLFQMVCSAFRLLGMSIAVQLGLYLATLMVLERIQKILMRSDVAALSLFAVSMCLLLMGLVFRWDLVLQLRGGVRIAIGFVLFFGFIRGLVMWHLQSNRVTTVEAGELRAGMRLTAETVAGLGTEKRVEPEALPDSYPDGLSQDEAHALRSSLSEHPQMQLQIHLSRPFAVWILAGCAWTLFFSQNVSGFLLSYWSPR